MKNETGTSRFSADDLAAMRARGEDGTDWDRVRGLTDAEVEAAVQGDPDEAGMTIDWSKAKVREPARKEAVTIRLDPDVLRFFRALGGGYQTRINAVLRSYMEHAKR